MNIRKAAVKPDKLAAMANQIAIYFHSYSGDRAVEGVAKHIEKFWTPRMRDTLRAQVLASSQGIDPLVVAAMTMKRAVPDPVVVGDSVGLLM